MDWLDEEIGEYEDDYLIIDCPGVYLTLVSVTSTNCIQHRTGQIELYTHHPFLPTLVKHLNRQGVRTCAAYLLESQFMEDKYKFFG